MEEFFGCIIQPPDPRDFRISALLGADDVQFPKTYIVPFYRPHFTADGKPKESLRKLIRTQYHDSCVGEAAAYQKDAVEGHRVSARDIFAHAKRLDGMGVDSYGTTLLAGQDACILPGPASESLIPEPGPEMNRADYVTIQSDSDGKIDRDRETNRNKSYFRAERNEFKKTLLDSDTPITTSYDYYEGDRMMRTNGGIMPYPTGQRLSGHSQVLIGWNPIGTLSLQSWGPYWGDCGVMTVPDEMLMRFTCGYVPIDMEPDTAKLLMRYDGYNVKSEKSPDVYRCELGCLRKYPDEITFWAFGGLFTEVLTVPESDLKAIPVGTPMDINGSNPRHRELIREIRQHGGQL